MLSGGGARRVLQGIRVVELTTQIAGPYCGKVLADAGADVVKVEPPGGDPLRSWRSGALFEFLNTSKRSVRGEPADAHVRALCARADLVVETLEPGVIESLGLHDANPALVVVSISPFGHAGPWRHRAATEFTLQAWCGSTGSRGVPEEPPLAAGGRIGEWVTASYAAVAALAALRSAERTGCGEHVDVAMLDCMSVSMNTYTSVFAEFLGWPPQRSAPRLVEIPSIEPTADGYVGFTTNSAQQFADFLVLIGRPDLVDDRELASALGRAVRRHEVREMIANFTTRHPTAEILEQAALLRIPVAPVGNGATVTGFDHFVDQGTFVPSPGGRFVQPRVPYRISGLASRPFEPAPALGEHDGAVDWTARVASPAAAPAGPAALPFAGLRVLDATAWWAGPAATHVLACLGADVVKVESAQRPDLMRYTSTRPPTEDRWWEWGPLFHGANNSKRGVTVNLADPEGRAVFERLLGTADVLVENFTPRVMEQFGLGWERVHALNPALVMLRMPAFGLHGPWRDRTGFAQTMEQITGMAWVTGWADGPPLIPRGPCDPLAAMHAVAALALAVRDRDHTGEGRLVEVTMVEAALNAAAEQVVEHGASGTVLAREGNRSAGAAPQGLYRCAGTERWLALAVADDDQWAAMRRVLGDPDWTADPALATHEGRRVAHDAIDGHLDRWCAERDLDDVVDALAAAGVAAAPVVVPRDIARNPQLRARGLFELEEHPVTGRREMPTLPFRFSGVDAWLRGPAPTLGQHTDEILRERLGCTEAELAALHAAAVTGDRPVGA